MKKVMQLALVIILVIFTTSCNNDDDNTPVNEEEVITTVTTILTGGGQTITLRSRDLDGDGPNQPVVSVSGNLTAGVTYTGATTFLNELANPATNITEEVAEEGPDHQVFYLLPSALGTITYNATDVDANGKPIGLRFSLAAGSSATTGTLTVKLIHMPNKNATGVAAGNSANAGGSTDAAVVFPIAIN